MPVGIEQTKQEEKMKKFLVVLLSLGLIVAFGATASAADVKFGGSYYVVGVYENNPLLSPDELGQAVIPAPSSIRGSGSSRSSRSPKV